MTTGWICPKCGKVFSPWFYVCTYCNNPPQIVTTTNAAGECSVSPQREPRRFRLFKSRNGSDWWAVSRTDAVPHSSNSYEVVEVVEVLR